MTQPAKSPSKASRPSIPFLQTTNILTSPALTMITVCAASRRLTLSNTIQGIYRAELARQRLETPNQYNRQQLFIKSHNSWSSRRPFSTSPVSPNETSNFTQDTAGHNQHSDSDVLTELTSTKADSNPRHPTPSTSTTTNNSSYKSAKSKTNQKNTSKEKKSRSTDAPPPTGPPKKVKREPWQIQKEALQKKFKEGWHPRKKLSPDTLDTIRHLHATKPEEWTTPALAAQFKVSPESIRRILKSRWTPTSEERQKRQERWQKRHDRIWSHMEQLGLRPRKGEQTAKLSDARRLGLESAPGEL